MTVEEQRAYGRGYYAAASRRWPAYAPPHPPQAEVQALFDAAKELNDAAVAVLSVIIPDEPVFIELQKRQGEMDAAFTKITDWLLNQPNTTSGTLK